MDTAWQLGLQGAGMSVASGSGEGSLPPSLPSSLLWTGQSTTSGGQGAQTLSSYPVAVLQEAGEVAVCRLEANEV